MTVQHSWVPVIRVDFGQEDVGSNPRVRHIPGKGRGGCLRKGLKPPLSPPPPPFPFLNPDSWSKFLAPTTSRSSFLAVWPTRFRFSRCGRSIANSIWLQFETQCTFLVVPARRHSSADTGHLPARFISCALTRETKDPTDEESAHEDADGNFSDV